MKENDLRQTDLLNLCQPLCEKYNTKLAKNEISQYLSGKVQPGADKLSIISQTFSVNEVWLMGYNVPKDPNALNLFYDDFNDTLSLDEQTHISTLRRFNDLGKDKVYTYAKDLLHSKDYLKELNNIKNANIIELPTYDDIKASAGLGSYTDGSSQPIVKTYELNNITRKADHAICIKGDSMEPIIEDGDTVFILEQPMINFDDIGIFVYQDEIYCKQLVKENGKIILRSKNKKYKDIIINKAYPLITVGKVLL